MIKPEYLAPYINNPVMFARDLLNFEPEAYQADILMSVAEKQMTSVKSGHGTGKTATAAVAVLWFLCTRPDARIPCTAPTEHQLKDILWSEIAKWLYRSPLSEALEWTNERVSMKGHEKTWFAVARVASKGDALQGFHAEHLFFVLEEASGIKEIMFEPVQGALTESNAKLLMIGNPTQLSGFFYNSHNKDAGIYSRFTLNAENSNRVSRTFINRIIQLYGIDSDAYRVRVLGSFPKAMADSFISMTLIDKGLKLNVSGNVTDILIGVDVARFGDDETVIQVVTEHNGAYKQQEPIILRKQDTMETAGTVINELMRLKNLYGIMPKVKVDETGIGAGVIDRLDEYRYNNNIAFDLTPINFGGRGGTLSGDPIACANNTGLLWGNVRNLLSSERLQILNDEALIHQLNNRKYRLNGNGEIVLERKEEMKKRGARSPDRADGLAIALAEDDKATMFAF